jgi:hypothetical protein
LADEIDPDVEGDLAVSLSEVVVQANLVGFAAKQNCRAEFVLGVTLSLEDVFVAEGAKDVVLALGHLVDEAGVDSRLAGDDVDANTAGVVLERDVFGVPVLEGVVGPFGKQFLKFVVTNTAVALARADAGLIERPGEPGNDGTIDERDILFKSGGAAELQGGDDAGGVVAVALADADAIRLGKMVVEVWIGQEDQGLKVWQPFGAAGGLPFEEGLQLLALAVGVDQRVIDCLESSVSFVIRPSTTIAAEFAFVTFDFDQEESARGDDERVNFINGAVIGNEGKIGPAAIWVAVWEGRSNEFESLGFPGEGGFGDALPALRRESHCFGLNST